MDTRYRRSRSGLYLPIAPVAGGDHVSMPTPGNPMTIVGPDGTSVVGTIGVAGPTTGLVVAGLDAGSVVRAFGADTNSYQITDPEGLDPYDDAVASLLAAGYPTVQTFTTTAAASMSFAFPMSMVLAGVSGGSNPYGPLIWPGGWIKALIVNGASQTLTSSSIGFTETVAGINSAPTWTFVGSIGNAPNLGVHRYWIPPGEPLKNLSIICGFASAVAAGAPITIALVMAPMDGGQFFATHLAANATTTVKTGQGVLHSITINTLGTADTITVYDNTAGSGTVIAVINAALSQSTLIFDARFATGLTLVIAGTTPPDITVNWR